MVAAKKKILLTGARSYVTLDLARQLEASGCEIHVAETNPIHVCRYSNAVTGSYTVPSPRFNHQGFIEELVKIIQAKEIDMLIPTCEEIFYISSSLDQFPANCTVFTEPFSKLEPLHNKLKFVQLLAKLGLPSPKTEVLQHKEDLAKISFKHPYILKASYCRASQQVHVVIPPNQPPNIPIEPHNPWIAQELLYGQKFCSYSIFHNGELKACSVYPVEYAIEGNSCLTFISIHHQGIIDWITKVGKAINFTGQVGFDFIQKQDGTLYAIECNPRATSGVHLFHDTNNLASAFFNTNQKMIHPTTKTRKQILMGMLMYGWRKQPHFTVSWKNFIKTFFGSYDVIFSRQDPLPTIMSPRISFMYWQMSKMLRKPLPAMFTHDIEWNNEEAHLGYPIEGLIHKMPEKEKELVHD